MDPYQVLGISRSASDDEIKKAYRALSRKYHPDANMNNPNKAFAEEKFKQVQQAYDLVMKERQRGGSYGSSYSNFSGGFRGNANSVAPELQAASNYLRTGHYNPLSYVQKECGDCYKTFVKSTLTSLMAECARSFEHMPILENASIIRNVLYSGIWTKYEYLQLKSKKKENV